MDDQSIYEQTSQFATPPNTQPTYEPVAQKTPKFAIMVLSVIVAIIAAGVVFVMFKQLTMKEVDVQTDLNLFRSQIMSDVNANIETKINERFESEKKMMMEQEAAKVLQAPSKQSASTFTPPGSGSKSLFVESSQVNLYESDIPSATNLATLQSADQGMSAQLIGSELYFINSTRGISVFNIANKQFRSLIIDFPSNEKKEVANFAATPKGIYYFTKPCLVTNDCQLYYFDFASSKTQLASANVEFFDGGGLDLLVYNSKNDSITYTTSYGDAGLAQLEYRQLNLNDYSSIIIRSLGYQGCGDEDDAAFGPCTPEMISGNQAYEAGEQFIPDQVRCGNITYTTSNKGQFISCVE